MNEENDPIEPIEPNESIEPIEETIEAKEDEWQEPALTKEIPVKSKEETQMSEISTLGNIFFEPSRVFADLRKKPRFIIGILLILLAISSFNILLVEKVGFENLVKAQLEGNSQVQQMPAKDRQDLITAQSKPLFKYIGFAVAPIFWLILILIGSLIYWLGINAFGGSAGFLQSLSVWVYSSFPPTVLYIVASLIILLLKPLEQIDLIQAQKGGILQANPSMFIDGKEMPVVAALLSSIDVFQIWGWILAMIGLKVIGKLSTGSALAIVVIMALVGITAKVVLALLF